ncbi:MAG TPA: pitrilysin family protein [Bryobacteraceae bacterium]|nr:pitrilysin family protein [Bryobacteraceae bacterium]
MSRFRLCTILAAALTLQAQDLKEFEKKVTEFTLPNGLHFIVAERHEAPVVSFHTYVNAGSVDDPSGETGLAHMFEHMAFKGTDTIGTKDWASEKKALDAIEEIYDRLEAERNRGPKADEGNIGALEAKLNRAIEEAQRFVEPNEYTRVIEESGGVGMNAGTALDSTEYYYSLPSNRIELWFLLESQRFLHPVFREFYKERDVVMEERRMRVESSPQGKLQEDFLTTAFAAHPYHNPPGGWPSDIASLRSSQAKAFFDKYYVPSNVIMAIVGDVNPADAKRMAERYFGPWQGRPQPPLVHTVEPPQPGPKTAIVESASQPIELIGYKRPDQYDKDDAVFDVIQLVLSHGRTGLLYKELVQDKKIALAAQVIGNFPGSRYPNLFTFVLVPSLGHTIEENQKALEDLLSRFEAQPVDAAALTRAKTQARAGVIRQLGNNSGLASLLTTYYAAYGDWRKLFTSLDELNKVTAADVQRVALRYFVTDSRTSAYTRQPAAAPARGARQ